MRSIGAVAAFVAAIPLFAQSYTTGFEAPAFAQADVAGQNGWGHTSNSPTTGFVEAAPGSTPAVLGAQSLAIRTIREDFLGVANNLYSPTISPAAGETGSTAVNPVPNPKARFIASFWYRTPAAAPATDFADGRFAELDPSSKGPAATDGANRYAVIRVSNAIDPVTSLSAPRVDIRSQFSSGFVNNTVAYLAWSTWYQFDIVVDLVDGLNGIEPNDRVKVTIRNAGGALVGSACGTTWEVGYKSGSFGGGTTPRAINGFDFWSYARPNGALVGYIDGLTMTTADAPAPLQASVSGSANVCSGGTTTLTAGATGGSGSIVTYVWRDGSNAIVGTSQTLDAAAGTYTVTITDSDCVNATSATFTVSPITCKATPTVTWSDPAEIVYGTPVGATQLNASPSVPGTLTYTPPAGTVLSAGAHQTLSVDFAPSDSAHYNDVNGTVVHINVVKAPTTITIDPISPNPAAVGQPVTVSFTLGGIIGTPSGVVTISDGVTSCTASPLAHSSCTLTFGTPGAHTLHATYSGDANHLGSTSSAATAGVRVAAATAVLDGSTTICAGSSAALHVSLTGTAPWTLTWSDGVTETTSSSAYSRSVTPSVTTTYAVVSVSDANGAGSSSGFATITVDVVPPPSITGPSPTKLGDAVTLHATPGYDSYQWFRNGAAIAGATSDAFTIAAVAQGDLGAYAVRATRGACASAQSSTFSLVLGVAPTGFDAVIPVVGNVPGVNGSRFRTTLELTNATDDEADGEITSIDASLPVYPYHLAAHETRFIDDLLPASYQSLTSANVRRLRGALPTILAHVFNDQGALGTSGLLERSINIDGALVAGDRAALLTPSDPIAKRMNIGLRSFADGMTVRITRRASDGTLLGTIDHTVRPSALEHLSAAALLGSAPGVSESLVFELLAGRGVIYGSATDNGTNDPNIQIAARLGDAPRSGRYIFAGGGSTAGLFGSRFATGLQIFNSTNALMTATLTFHPAGVSRTFTIAPNHTLSFDDVVAAIADGLHGLGSIDVATDATTRPVLLARVYSIDAKGQTSATTPLVAEEDVLTAGEEAVIVAPHTESTHRLNIGVRTLASGAQITATVRNAAGVILRTVTLQYPPTWFVQSSAESLLGIPFTGDESIVFKLSSGSAIVYATWTDNVTQDPALQYAVRVGE